MEVNFLKQITWHDLQHIIKDGDVIGLSALAVANLPAEVLRAVLAQHDKYQTPNALTFILANDIHSLGVAPDLDDFIERGMIKRVIMSILTASSKTAQAMKNNEIEAYFLPQGVIATHYRQSNHLLPGVLTKIGLNTAVDPRYGGGKVNKCTTEDLVSIVNMRDETYLHYTFPSVDVALLRGTYADKQGNIYLTQEAYLSECYHVALNTKANHGTVIVQVKAIVDDFQLKPHDVIIPGSIVDYVYVTQEDHNHRQVIQSHYLPALSGQERIDCIPEKPLPFNNRKLILRRAAQFLTYGDTISIGYGINNELSNLLYEERVAHDVQPILDVGIFGGFVGSRERFGMNYNADVRMRHDQAWDFIYNNGVSVAYLSFAEVDQYGNVNVSYFNDRLNGCGGFIDITQSVNKIIFSGTFVAGSTLSCYEHKLDIESEGHTKKFVSEVSHIDFNAQYSRSLNQEVYFVTDRAVFELVDKGLKLIEIAPGLDLQKDILNQMSFKPIIADNIKLIDSSIYQKQWGQLKQSIHKV
uniref:fatty acid degradation protein FadX n=1 Tax=Staphylococcus argenteus TaxID=985002 RepID=UPI001FB92415|nr:CoA-transferase [Staphylococcus argenteus]